VDGGPEERGGEESRGEGREGKGEVSERDKSSSHATFLTRSRVTNRIGKYPAFGFVHKRSGNEFSRDMGLPGRHFIAKKNVSIVVHGEVAIFVFISLINKLVTRKLSLKFT